MEASRVGCSRKEETVRRECGMGLGVGVREVADPEGSGSRPSCCL